MVTLGNTAHSTAVDNLYPVSAFLGRCAGVHELEHELDHLDTCNTCRVLRWLAPLEYLLQLIKCPKRLSVCPRRVDLSNRPDPASRERARGVRNSELLLYILQRVYSGRLFSSDPQHRPSCDRIIPRT